MHGLQAIAPAPAGGRKPRAASVASSSGGNGSSTTGGGGGGGAKGKGKARADGEGAPSAKGGSGKKAGGKAGKRGQQVGPDGKPLPKKKKAGRACAACQKAHLTCDDARPCARCIKKGCPEECVDGARKKAKYLQEIPDEPGVPISAPTTSYDPTSFLSFPASLGGPSAAGTAPTPSASVVDATQFGSEAAGYEYAILNAMLNGNGFALDTHTTPTLSGFGNSGGAGAGAGAPEPSPGGSGNRQPDPMLLDGGAGASGAGEPSGAGAAAAQAAQAQAQRTAFSASPQPGGLMTAEEAYRSVTKPYPYAQSYHFLVKHLKQRCVKNDILRIIRALATFRPSLIALQMPLTEEDETFVERTFQRTLVELNKLVSFSGTPTVVWRRTGEICLVGTEFCLLTGWKREDLVGKKYIFELFDTASVVEYYESFAKHAFESTATSITMQCVVLAPDGRPVPCAFCFSVRRDLFSCPFLVIGSFLPVLV
ncbi:transcription activator of gluconeogenesis ERT1 [Rhodotorula diobovata]|uniref:Transcription activator of gluconeogenesis ERT1 n=1 Tax=Rhodotorula diobovata TaxID=5288 RepID=A0A5C5FXA3_9BASI|nr:transcription activator of gluconeogenesis ERT1 [Rhodotorula diobovata]